MHACTNKFSMHLQSRAILLLLVCFLHVVRTPVEEEVSTRRAVTHCPPSPVVASRRSSVALLDRAASASTVRATPFSVVLAPPADLSSPASRPRCLVHAGPPLLRLAHCRSPPRSACVPTSASVLCCPHCHHPIAALTPPARPAVDKNAPIHVAPSPLLMPPLPPPRILAARAARPPRRHAASHHPSASSSPARP